MGEMTRDWLSEADPQEDNGIVTPVQIEDGFGFYHRERVSSFLYPPSFVHQSTRYLYGLRHQSSYHMTYSQHVPTQVSYLYHVPLPSCPILTFTPVPTHTPHPIVPTHAYAHPLMSLSYPYHVPPPLVQPSYSHPYRIKPHATYSSLRCLPMASPAHPHPLPTHTTPALPH